MAPSASNRPMVIAEPHMLQGSSVSMQRHYERSNFGGGLSTHRPRFGPFLTKSCHHLRYDLAMLMFVFGAGASYDSDPTRLPSNDDPDHYPFETQYRPPLAKGLFQPLSEHGRAAITAFPRAASLIMELRHATAQGRDVEEVLEQIQLGETAYPETATQLLAFRAYLARLLTRVPDEWVHECQGLTNYVLALAQADRWNVTVHAEQPSQAIACVTFNYDTLLEQAIRSVFGHDINDINDYSNHRRVHIHKPHGSVDWRRAAQWNHRFADRLHREDALHKAIARASSLEWTDEWRRQINDIYQDDRDHSRVWLPALSIPVRSKSDFTMPSFHRDAMIADIRQVTTLVAVGWRARERHFLKLLQDEMPSEHARVVAVGPTPEAADETIENLWETGRFNRFATSSLGFSGFAQTPDDEYRARPKEHRTHVHLRDVLSNNPGAFFWTKREPGPGLATATPPTLLDPGYADL